MPRIFYVILFLVFTLIPFPIIWIGQAFLAITTPDTANTAQTSTTSSNYSSHSYHTPFYGGFFYYGSSGRGSWLGRAYRSSGSGGVLGSSRSYSGGNSSFGSGGFGAFGK